MNDFGQRRTSKPPRSHGEEGEVRVSLRLIKPENDGSRKEGYEIRGANLATNSEATSDVQHWKAPKITLRCDNKGMNLDGRTTIILFDEISTQKKVVEDFMVTLPKSRNEPRSDKRRPALESAEDHASLR